MKKILFLGGSNSQLPAIKYAKEQGYYIIITDYLPNNPGRKIAHKYYNVSTTDVERVMAIAKKEKIDAVSAFASDPAALTAANICEKFNLVGNSVKSINILSKKHIFRNFLIRNNFNSPSFFSSQNIKELLSFYKKQNQKKMVLKPIDTSGSKGVFFINNEKELIENFNKSLSESPSKTLILEEFIERKGPQIHGEGFVINGKLEFLLLGDQYFDKNKGLIPFSTIVPSIEHKNHMHDAYEIVKNIIQKSGFKNGGINVEIIRNNNNKLYVLEIGGRSGGNFMPQLAQYASGVDLVKANIDILFNKTINLAPKYNNNYYAQIILHAPKSGILKKITFSSFFNKNLMEHHYYKIGDYVNKYSSSRDVIGVNIFEINGNAIKNKRYMDELYAKDFVIVEEKSSVRIEIKKENPNHIKMYLEKNNSFFTPLQNRVDINQFSNKIFKNAEQFWVIDKNKTVGFAAVYMNNDFSFITTISIMKEYQNKGYGKELINRIIEKTKEKNKKYIMLEVDKKNLSAISFYKKFDFFLIEENEHNLVLKKVIKK